MRPEPGSSRARSDHDRELLVRAIDLAKRCPPSTTAFAVGALIAASDGTILGEGWSRKGDPHEHAEEAALAEVADPAQLEHAMIYSSLEPCSTPSSRPVTCTQHILNAQIPRVVYAWREPSLFVDCVGDEMLRDAGLEVIYVPDLTEAAREPNLHLFAK